MSSRSNPLTVPAPQSCDYCHQKPKFPPHSYCGKTCAAQAAAQQASTLCNFCHLKPKFGKFEYCGKNCAAQAGGGKSSNSGHGSGNAGGGQQTQQSQATYKGGAKGSGFPFNAQAQKQTAVSNLIPALTQLAQQIPQAQAFLAAASNVIAPAPAPPARQQAPAPTGGPPPPPPFSGGPTKNPFLSNPNSQAPQAKSATVKPSLNPFNSAPVQVQVQTHNTTVSVDHDWEPVAASDECLIPGCVEPVHVDADGVRTSDYCSMSHREEAVSAGLASPCIMCLSLPQSGTDYFCSRACREEALNKQGEAEASDE